MSKDKCTFSYANVGDRVWSSLMGWCVVVDRRSFNEYSIGVQRAEVDSDITYYTIRGKRNTLDKYAELYWREGVISLMQPKPVEIDWAKVDKGTQVLGARPNSGVWEPARYAMYLPNAVRPHHVYSNVQDYEASTSLLVYKKCKIDPNIKVLDRWLK